MDSDKGKGFTSIELMIVITIVLVVVFLAANVIMSVGGRNAEVAQEQAVTWARDMGYDVKGVSCLNVDTDGDGYVSCSVRTDGQVLGLLCSRAWTFFHTGCKMPLGYVPALNPR